MYFSYSLFRLLFACFPRSPWRPLTELLFILSPINSSYFNKVSSPASGPNVASNIDSMTSCFKLLSVFFNWLSSVWPPTAYDGNLSFLSWDIDYEALWETLYNIVNNNEYIRISSFILRRSASLFYNLDNLFKNWVEVLMHRFLLLTTFIYSFYSYR